MATDYDPDMRVASKRRRKFHRVDGCKWKIKPENLVEFENRREAIDAGYKPCGTCRA